MALFRPCDGAYDGAYDGAFVLTGGRAFARLLTRRATVHRGSAQAPPRANTHSEVLQRKCRAAADSTADGWEKTPVGLAAIRMALSSRTLITLLVITACAHATRIQDQVAILDEVPSCRRVCLQRHESITSHGSQRLRVAPSCRVLANDGALANFASPALAHKASSADPITYTVTFKSSQNNVPETSNPEAGIFDIEVIRDARHDSPQCV